MELLNYVKKNGMIDVTCVQAQFKMNKRKEFLEAKVIKKIRLFAISNSEKPSRYKEIGVTGFEELALPKKYVNTLFFEGVF